MSQDDPLEKLESLIGTIKLKYYHADEWLLDEANYKLVRIRKRPRRSLFTPGPGCPVELDQLSGVRTTYLDFGQCRQIKSWTSTSRTCQNQILDRMSFGKVGLLNSPPPSRRYLTKGPPPGVPTPAAKHVDTEQIQDAEITEDI